MNRVSTFLFVVVLAVAAEHVALGQYQSTASRVRDLESRLDKLIQLQEGFLPTLERMNSRLDTMEQKLGAVQSAGSRKEATADVAELQKRLSQLEKWVESTGRRQTWGVEELTWVSSEFDILTSRVNGLEGRIEQLTQRPRYTNASEKSVPRQQQVVVSEKVRKIDPPTRQSAFTSTDDQAGAIRLIIDIQVTTDRDGNITVYRTVR